MSRLCLFPLANAHYIMKTEILYEDKNILVCYKPAGLAVQTGRIGQADMVSELKNYLRTARKAQPIEDMRRTEPYLGLVHRLDQPVEGLLVFAKTKAAAADLSAQVQNGKMKKEYTAGIYTGRQTVQGTGTLVDYLYKDAGTNTSRVVPETYPGAKQAGLQYFLLQQETELGFLRIRLQTGRHHQIRVQLANAGMPLLGDTKYGSPESQALSARLGIREPALCASRLSFYHPATKKRVQFEAVPRGKGFSAFKGV